MKRLVTGALVVVLLGAAFVVGGPRSSVDWSRLRAVAIESDDWGLAGFVPGAEAWRGLDREEIAPGRFPAVYWGSTLEDSAAVIQLADILDAARGRDGLPAILQANYVMSSLSWTGDGWRRHDWPALPESYRRPGLWSAVRAARAQGVWRAEYHGTWHYDPERRRRDGLATPATREATRRGITLFPGSEAARELGPWRDPALLERELTGSLELFTRVFGRDAVSVIAPDYAWHGAVEELWESRGLRIIQAKREQRNPRLPSGLPGRLLKLVGRRWDAWRHPRRSYLERNCRFEPVQGADPVATVARCAVDVVAAWRRGEPAVVESHRVNFVHTDAGVADRGRRALEALLAEVAALEPLFLVDAEVAQLARRGVSRSFRGQTVVLRNGSRSRRVVTVPRSLLEAVGGGPHDRPLVVAVPAGTTVRLVGTGGGWRTASSGFLETSYHYQF